MVHVCLNFVHSFIMDFLPLVYNLICACSMSCMYVYTHVATNILIAFHSFSVAKWHATMQLNMDIFRYSSISTTM